MKRAPLHYTGSETGSDSKRVRNPSEHTENELTAIFLYLGVVKFFTISTKLRASAREVLPHIVKVDTAFDQLIRDDQIKPQWENYLKEIAYDNKMFFRFFNCNLRHNEGVVEDYFTLHCCEELTYYIYCFEKYQRCCESKWQFWQKVFLT